MSDYFIGQIKMFAGNFAPSGWALCNGQILPIAQNTALFSLLGTTYGGNGQTTFALPDLRGRVPVKAGQGVGLSDHSLGEAAGQEAVTLTLPEMPSHGHGFGASTANADQRGVAGNVPAVARDYRYLGRDNHSAMHANSVAPTGGNQPHNNMQPFLCINFIIALNGIFPTRS